MITLEVSMLKTFINDMQLERQSSSHSFTFYLEIGSNAISKLKDLPDVVVEADFYGHLLLTQDIPLLHLSELKMYKLSCTFATLSKLKTG